MIAHLYRVTQSIIREHLYKIVARSGDWRSVRKDILSRRSSCEACGSTVRLQVHLRQPFHLHPELELDETNLIVLCMDVNECHLKIGHGDNFKAYNPNVTTDAQEALEHPDQIPVIIERAKEAVLYAIKNPFLV